MKIRLPAPYRYNCQKIHGPISTTAYLEWTELAHDYSKIVPCENRQNDIQLSDSSASLAVTKSRFC